MKYQLHQDVFLVLRVQTWLWERGVSISFGEIRDTLKKLDEEDK